MSRIGKLPITVPAGITIAMDGSFCVVKGPKGEVRQEITGGITISQKDGIASVNRPDDSKQSKALHGL